MKLQKNIEKKNKKEEKDTKSKGDLKEKENLKMDFMTAMKKILSVKPPKKAIFILFSLLNLVKNISIFK
jgi:hypothetical protein